MCDVSSSDSSVFGTRPFPSWSGGVPTSVLLLYPGWLTVGKPEPFVFWISWTVSGWVTVHSNLTTQPKQKLLSSLDLYKYFSSLSWSSLPSYLLRHPPPVTFLDQVPVQAWFRWPFSSKDSCREVRAQGGFGVGAVGWFPFRLTGWEVSRRGWGLASVLVLFFLFSLSLVCSRSLWLTLEEKSFLSSHLFWTSHRPTPTPTPCSL